MAERGGEAEEVGEGVGAKGEGGRNEGEGEAGVGEDELGVVVEVELQAMSSVKGWDKE